jgi:hypothetical protein
LRQLPGIGMLTYPLYLPSPCIRAARGFDKIL